MNSHATEMPDPETRKAPRDLTQAFAADKQGGVCPLAVENISKNFRQGMTSIKALSNVALRINQGEIVAIMGPSGSGKSTLLHAIAGLTSVDSGRVMIAGQELGGLSDHHLTAFRRKHVGLVFQSFNLIPSLTAEQNIMLPIRSAGGDDSAGERLENLLTDLKLQDRRKHRPDALSGGEQQRVAIARALIADPSIILADEPTGSLDSITGQSICKLFRKLNQDQHRTIAIVTHEPSVAVWTDRVVVLSDGKIIAEFNTRDFSDPQALAAHYQEVTTPKLNREE